MAALATALLTGCGILQPSLTVINNSSYTITQLSLTNQSSASIVEPDDVNILSGSTYVIESVWAGTYVLYAEDAEGYWERPDFVLQRGRDSAWTLYNGDRKPF